MRNSASEPVGVLPLTHPQTAALEKLVHGITPEQALWLSGYLAALARSPDVAPAPTARPSPTLTVLFGTETGNAAEVARQLVRRAGERGMHARAVDMAEYQMSELRDESRLAVITATHGDGDPPDPASGFFEHLLGRKAPRLERVRFAVLALGDSSYVEYCRAGRDLDARLEALGAIRLLERVECDVDFRGDAGAWIESALTAFERAGAAEVAGDARKNGAAPVRAPSEGTTGATSSLPGLPQGPPVHTRDSPYPAELLDAHPLTGLFSDKETFHLELRIEEGALTFEPGDSLGVVAENEDAVVDAVLTALGRTPGDTVQVRGEQTTLADALRRDIELTILTPRFIAAWAELAEARELVALLEPERRDDLLHFMRCHQLPDVITQHPVPGLDADRFVEITRPLRPRLYSIASSPRWLGDQVDLTVAIVRSTPDGKRRNGLVSSWLADRRTPGDTVPVFVDHNPSFRLPSDPETPIVMIGAGTGVAPFRAFLQDREATGATGGNWLFFGERRAREDFLYQTEWQRLLRDGRLSQLDVAFSRDGPKRCYVQHRLRDRASDVWRWLEDGAHLYVCGDAFGLAPGVEATLLEIIEQEGGHAPDDARAHLDALRRAGRYQRDVY